MCLFVPSIHAVADNRHIGYAASSWRTRWWLLDGFLVLLYFIVFTAIAYLWRPSDNNARYVYFSSLPAIEAYLHLKSTLAMSDELAQDEEDAEDYDLEAIQSRTRARDEDDNETLVGSRRGGAEPLPGESVVFEIGDDDDEDDVTPRNKQHHKRLSGENDQYRPVGGRDDEERRGLVDRRDD